MPEDEDLDEEEIPTIINLNDFLSFDGKGIKCVDNLKRRVSRAPGAIDNQCGKLQLQNGKLIGTCNVNGSPAKSDLNINDCIGNSNSFLKKGGHFQKSCQFCSVTQISSINVLTCTCKDMRQRTRRASVPLNSLIMLFNGRLMCLDQAVIDAAEKARKEAAEKARKDAEEKARKEAAEKARKDAEEKKRKDAAEKARKDAEEKARKDAEEKARKEAAEKARKDAEEKKKKRC